MTKAKKINKKKVVPCTDANQRAREHAAHIKHREEVALKRMQHLQELFRQRQAMNAPAVDATSPEAFTPIS